MKFIWKLLTLTTAAGAGAAAMFFLQKTSHSKTLWIADYICQSAGKN